MANRLKVKYMMWLIFFSFRSALEEYMKSNEEKEREKLLISGQNHLTTETQSNDDGK